MNVPKTKSDEPRINQEIRVDSVRLVNAAGDMVGVVKLAEALRLAEEAGLDLVEISPNAEPPVCKILDYGKYKYEAQKKANEARKKQKVIVVKEIKLRPTIDEHDYAIKMKSVHKFLAEGDKVKITLKFRGRELSHREIGQQVLERVEKELGEEVKVEMAPRFEGKQMIMMVAPK